MFVCGTAGQTAGVELMKAFLTLTMKKKEEEKKKTGSLHLFLQVMEQNELMCHDERYNWIKWAR